MNTGLNDRLNHEHKLGTVSVEIHKHKCLQRGSNTDPFRARWPTQNAQKTDLKKSQICPISCQSDPILDKI